MSLSWFYCQKFVSTCLCLYKALNHQVVEDLTNEAKTGAEKVVNKYELAMEKHKVG